MKKAVCLLLLSLLALGIYGCASPGLDALATIQDLSYPNKSEEMQNTVYLSENGEPVPYLVVSDNYDGHVLLLRKELAPDRVPYRNEKRYNVGAGYYGESDVDRFLNEEFACRYSEAVRTLMVESGILITSRDTVCRSDNRRNTERISRRIFLLSATEVTGERSAMTTKEGSFLSFFQDREEALGPQWLRSAYLWDDVHAWAVDSTLDGALAAYSEHVSARCFVRPAFCVPRDTPIYPCSVDGQTAYSLEPPEDA